MSKLWSYMIIFSFIISIFTGRLSLTAQSALEGASDAVTMCVSLLGVICMWNGIMKIAEKSGVIAAVSYFLKPVMRFLFKNVKPDSAAGKAIIMNISANLLGMGNAATPAALTAINELGKEADGRHTKDIFTFTLINTVSIQLIPSTVIAMRSAAGSENAAEIILPVWCASLCSLVVAVIYSKIFWGKKI